MCPCSLGPWLESLYEHLPRPRLPADTGALLASLVEPDVTADQVALPVPFGSIRHFAVLDDLLGRAVQAAQDGELLGPATQPEMREMRAWLCSEVARQADHQEPRPWAPRTDVRAPFAVRVDVDAGRTSIRTELSRSTQPMIATDHTSVIIAVTPRIVEFLGYRDASLLLGRRILVVIPPWFHQAHIAGATLNATNGRDVLLNQWLTVPVVRADDTEVMVELHVEPRRLHDDTHVFVAELRVDP